MSQRPQIPDPSGVKDPQAVSVLRVIKSVIDGMSGRAPNRHQMQHLGVDANLYGAIDKINEIIERLQEESGAATVRAPIPIASGKQTLTVGPYAAASIIAFGTTTSLTAAYATSAGTAALAGTAIYAGTSAFSTSAAAATTATSAGVAATAGTAAVATLALSATTATRAGTASTAGTASYATVSGAATTATNAGMASHISGGAGGSVPYQTGTSTTSMLAAGAANLRLFMNAAGSAPEWGSQFKMVATTKNTADASGTQAFTGAGFKPSAVIVLMIINNSAQWSIGIDDGTTPRCIFDNHNIAADTFGYNSSSSVLIQGAGINYIGQVSSFDADGCTMTWTKTGAKTSTALLFLFFMR